MANVQVLFARFGLKTTSSLNTHKNYRCKASTLKHTEMIALFMLSEQLIFIEVGRPNYWGTGGKIGLKLEKCPKDPNI